MTDPRIRVCGLVGFYWRAGQLVCDDPLGHRQVALRPDAERLLRRFATWAPLADADGGCPAAPRSNRASTTTPSATTR